MLSEVRTCHCLVLETITQWLVPASSSSFQYFSLILFFSANLSSSTLPRMLRSSKQNGVCILVVALRWGIDIAACSCFSHIKRDYLKENEERTSHVLSVHGGKKRRRGSFTELTRDWRVAKRCAGIEHMLLHMHTWMHQRAYEHKYLHGNAATSGVSDI